MISRRAASFQESVIREMTRLHQIHGGVNLAQGFPDFDPPADLLEAAARALLEGYNQYSITWGAPELRREIARHAREFNRIPADPETQITVCCGATETMIATLLAVCNPGDEVVIFTPFYENYGPDAVLSGALPVYVPLRRSGGGWGFDPDELARAFSPRTRAVIVNTPHNPSGHVFTRAELETIADEDPLVPVLNRRSFVRELERALAYVARYKTSASLVYCDLDDFKGVNDRHGHAAGDAALQFFAHFLLDSVRKSDLVGRLGGDEFAIVLHHADEKAALEKAHRLADRLAKQSVQHNGQIIALAMSTGTTELKREDGAGDVLERADSAMYAAKTKNKRKKSATKLQAERQ